MAHDRRRRNRLLALSPAVALGVLVGAVMHDSRGVADAGWRQLAPWCAYLGGLGGGFDCSYYTFEQCMATARGLGGWCSPNPGAAAAPEPYRTRRRARR